MNTRVLRGLNFSGVGQTLPGFFSWWKGEILTLLPKKVQNFLFPEGKTVRLRANGNLEIEGLDAIPKDVDRLEIPLDPSLVFKKTAPVPKAGKTDLRKILDLQIEHLFPLTRDSLYFSYSQEKPGFVTLFIAKRADLDPILKALEASSVQSGKVIIFPQGEGRETAFPIKVKGRGFQAGRLKTPAVYSLLFWLVAGLAYPFYLDLRAGALQEEIDGLQGRVAQEMAAVSAFEETRLKRRAISGALEEAQALSVFGILSETFPEGAWVDNFSFGRGEVTLSGVHPSPTELVSNLAGTGHFRDVRLTSTEELGNTTRFQIVLVPTKGTKGGRE